MSAGHYEGERLEYSEGDNLRLLFIKDGLLSGFLMMGDVARAGIYTALHHDEPPPTHNNAAPLNCALCG